jgi:predicted P-loop ATPase
MNILPKFKGVVQDSNGWTAKCPAHGDRQASLSIAHRDGKWLLNCHKGCTTAAICQAIDVEMSDLFDAPKKTKSKRTPAQIFADAQILTPTFPYFSARGLDVGAFSGLASVVRYEPKCWHKENQTEKPALIAAVTNGDGAVSAIQRIYLTDDGKAKACKPMSLGRTKGLAIRLGPPTETVYLAEGFEDAATAQQADSGASAWAATGASNLPNVEFPETTKTVVLLGQNDRADPGKHDPAFARYAMQAVQKLIANGKQARIAWPPGGVRDINDFVRGKASTELSEGYARAKTMLEDATAATPTPGAPPSRTTWAEQALVDGHGAVMPVIANVLLALRLESELTNCLAYDELLRAAVLTAPLPLVQGARHAGNDPLPRMVTDEDVTQLQEWLQWNGLPKVGKDIIHQAIDRRAREFPFHKLRAWLNGLAWDGKPRLEACLTVYLGAPDSLYHREIGKMFLIAMAARVLEPGCQADYVLILQGGQGDLKSSACRILAGDEYFSDDLPNIRDKDSKQFVRGLWLIELSELTAMSRADLEHWKAFVTRRTERYRQPYGRRETVEPRQCLFVGTTNRDEFLQDETGNRRFWPALVGLVNLGALRRDREQLFAEAVHLYRSKEPWWPDQEFERKYIAAEQEARFESDVWEPVIANYLDKIIPEKNQIRVCDVAQGLGFETSRISTADARRIRRVLHRLGWRQPFGSRKTADRFYYRAKT